MTLWSIIGGIVCAFGAVYLAGHAAGIRLERSRDQSPHVNTMAMAERDERFIEALAYEAERVSKESRAVYELPDEAEETEPEGPTVR